MQTVISALPPVAPRCAATTLRDAAELLENPGPGVGRVVTYQPPAGADPDHLVPFVGRRFVVTAVESHDLGDEAVVVLLDGSAVMSVVALHHVKAVPSAVEQLLATQFRVTADAVEVLDLHIEELSVYGQTLTAAREVITAGGAR